MASFFEDFSQWRLTSPGGGVPMKFKGLEGEFEEENGVVSFKALIPSSSLTAFLIGMFPPTIYIGNMVIPQSIPLPNLPGMIARRISFAQFDDSKPIDPFGFDPTADPDTYYPVIEVTIEYGPRVKQAPQANDPRTFLEISANATGEFIHSTAPKAKWKNERQSPDNEDDDVDPGTVAPPQQQAEAPDPHPNPPEAPDPAGTDAAPGESQNETDPVKDPNIPLLIMVPQTEWTVKWNQIPYWYFYNTLVRRLRWCLGRVNEEPMAILHNALPETILFMGYSYTQTHSWRDGSVSTPPINLEMKFLEKRVVNDHGVIIGHNHFWRPGVGWRRLLIDGVNPVYRLRNMNVIYQI